MELKVSKTSYYIEIEKNIFINKIIEESGKCLFQKLSSIVGISNVEYDGHFGNYVFLDIGIDYDNKTTYENIINIIKKHIE
jgi:hypothetical protein